MPLGRTGANGGVDTGVLTTQQVARVLVQPLQNQSVFLSSGVHVIDTAGPLRIPRQAQPTTPGWVAENAQIGEVNPVFDDLTLLPDTMQSVKVITRFSNELLRSSVVALDAALQQRLVSDVAEQLDLAFIGSTVTDGSKPLGMVNYAGTQTVNVSGPITVDAIMDAWGLALTANANVSNMRLFMRPETFTAMRKLKTATGSSQYLLQPDPTADGVFRVLGTQVIVTNHLPVTGATGSKKTSAVLVDTSQIFVARDNAPSVTLLTERYADFDQVGIRVTARYDAAIANPQAEVVLTNISASG